MTATSNILPYDENTVRLLHVQAHAWRRLHVIDEAAVNLAQALLLLCGRANELATSRRHSKSPDLVCLQHELAVSITAFLAQDFGESRAHLHQAIKWRDALTE